MSNNRIKVSDLDYNQIRDNLKTFMQGQSQFSDYDFDGSALSTLIDLLAYNTHYNALYTNLAVNEMFLDSASKRNSVVSIANNFGYTPISPKCSRSTLTVRLTQENATETVKYLPKYSSFTSTIDNVQYSFYTLKDYSAQRNGNVYTFENVEVFEGIPQTLLFVCTTLGEKFTLPNLNIDTDTIEITVQPAAEQPDYEKYTLARDILDLTPTSKIYFLKELSDQTYQIYFGSAGLGLPINTGNIITVRYLITNKTSGNGAALYTYSGASLGGLVDVTSSVISYSGKESETVDQIKYNVTQNFFDQNRAVTPGDYVALIKRLYTNLDSISVWGGEDNDPPQYGRVYISIKPATGPYLTPPEKTYITESLLKARNVVSITPIIIDPTYIELQLNTTVYFNPSKTTRSVDQLKAAVISGIQNYRETSLQKYDGVFRMSKFASMIDGLDQSISSSITTFTANVEVIPKYNVAAEYKLNLVNPIYSDGVPTESFKSTGFYLDSTDTIYYLDDDGVGNIRVFTTITTTGEKVIRNASIGTIDYQAGKISVNGLKILNLYEANFYFTIKTESFDVVSVRNQIVDIPDSRITVNIIEDAVASGTYKGGTNYIFTNSRS